MRPYWLVAAALALTCGLGRSEERRDKDARSDTRAEWRVDRKQAQDNLRKELVDLRARIERLGASGKIGADDVAAKLRERADRLEGRVERLDERGARGWERARDRIHREYNELSDSIRDWERRRNERQ